MDQLERYGSAHECIAYLLYQIEVAELIAMAAAAAKLELREIVRVKHLNPRLEVPGIVKAAHPYIVDLVFLVETADGERQIWVFEVELNYVELKITRWARYEINFEDEFRAGCRVVVFTPQPKLRRKIQTKLIPKMKTKPIVIQRDQIPRITDYDEARARPEHAVLGALYHAQPPARVRDQLAVFRAAWVAIQSLAEPKARRYSVAIMRVVPKTIISKGIEQLREAGELDEEFVRQVSDTERLGWSFQTGWDEGREEGRVVGREEGRAVGREEAARELLRAHLVDVLELRGFVLTPDMRERIAACDSIETLERWYAAAKAAAANTELAALLAD